jgi:ABC-type uncharacterized transport system substrate-binding protein
MRRREFISLLGGLAAIPLTAHTQQAAVPVVGFLSSRSPGESSDVVVAFRKGLRQMGFAEGENIVIAFRWAEGHYERLSALASNLVNMHVSVLVAAGGSPSALAAKRVTSTIPIVFTAGSPLLVGLVTSLNKPGANITGIGNLAPELPGKSLGLLRQIVPKAETIGYLVNPSSPTVNDILSSARAAAGTLGLQLREANASTPAELDEAFANLAKLRIGALGVMPDPFFDTQRDRIVELSARYRIATCYPWREYVLAGGLMSYGNNAADLYRQAGIYTARILSGESPSNLPVMQLTKFEFVLNLKTAKALGLTVPPGILSIADEVIE